MYSKHFRLLQQTLNYFRFDMIIIPQSGKLCNGVLLRFVCVYLAFTLGFWFSLALLLTSYHMHFAKNYSLFLKIYQIFLLVLFLWRILDGRIWWVIVCTFSQNIPPCFPVPDKKKSPCRFVILQRLFPVHWSWRQSLSISDFFKDV